MPKFDFDVITLAHGSGGLLMRQLLESGVFDVLRNEALDAHHDGALLDLKGPLAFSTDSFVISPIFFPGGDIGELAINGTVNDVAMCGAEPRYLSLSFILEEGLSIEEFWRILVSIRNAADAAGVHVVTGDTKVVEKGKGDRIFINTSGIGVVHPHADIGLRRVRPGDAVIISGPVATHGTAIMAVREGLNFDTPITSDTRPLHRMVKDLLDTVGTDVHLLRDPTRGGVAATLNEIAQDAQVGVELDQAALPVLPEVKAMCEILGLDPLYIANEGVFMACVASDRAEDALAVLRRHSDGAHATVIGRITDAHPGQVLINTLMGGRRVVHMPLGEQLPRIC